MSNTLLKGQENLMYSPDQSDQLNSFQTDIVIPDENSSSDVFQEEALLPELMNFVEKFNGENYVKHFLSNQCIPINPSIPDISNAIINKAFLWKKQLYKTLCREKDYEEILMHVEKAYKLIWFRSFRNKIYKHLGEEKYYELLGGTLVYVNRHYYMKRYYHQLLWIGTNPKLMMNNEERIAFNDLPDRLTIFRGVSSEQPIESTNFSHLVGNSWTNDRDMAIWFANHYVQEGAIHRAILEYEISKSDIISFFTPREEAEVFVDYKKLNYKNIKLEIMMMPFQRAVKKL